MESKVLELNPGLTTTPDTTGFPNKLPNFTDREHHLAGCRMNQAVEKLACSKISGYDLK